MCSRMRGPAISPFLGHVADDQHRRAGVLREAHQARRRLAHLRRPSPARIPMRRSASSGSSRRRARARWARGLLEIVSTRVSASKPQGRRLEPEPARRAGRPGAPIPRPSTYSTASLAAQRVARPAAASSTCRCRDRRRAASPTRHQPAAQHAIELAELPVAARIVALVVTSVTVLLVDAPQVHCAGQRRAPRCPRRSLERCSTPRRRGTGPATAPCARRKRRRRSWFGAWPWVEVRRSGGSRDASTRLTAAGV